MIHVEPTNDAGSWRDRERRYRKKFNAGKKYIPALFEGLDLPDKDEIDHICLLGYGSSVNHPTLAGGRVVTVADFLADVIEDISRISIHKNAISESHPILRTLQYITQNRLRFSELLRSVKGF